MTELTSRTKLMATTVGVGAVLTMGGLSLAVAGQPTVTPLYVSGGMQTGVTMTETTPDTVLATSMAVPTVKATFYGKS